MGNRAKSNTQQCDCTDFCSDALAATSSQQHKQGPGLCLGRRIGEGG